MGPDEPIARRALLQGIAAVGIAAKAKATKRPPKAPSSKATIPTTSVATTTVPVVVGSNKALTHEILADDASSYNGTWSGTWKVVGGRAGTLAGAVRIDADARTISADLRIDGPIVGGATLQPATITVAIDSSVYAEQDGKFTVSAASTLCRATITDNGGFGKFRLIIDAINGHPDVTRFEATGVANKPSSVPIEYTTTFSSGRIERGSIEIHPG